MAIKQSNVPMGSYVFIGWLFKLRELKKFRSVLKTRVPYFDALFRWHGYECEINLDATKETISFLCIFLLNSDLKGLGLNFDQVSLTIVYRRRRTPMHFIAFIFLDDRLIDSSGPLHARRHNHSYIGNYR